MADPDRSEQFNTLLLIATSIAGTIALCIVWVVYGCAKHSTPPKPREQSPGMYVMMHA